jgi:hypothetical protein
MATSPCNCCLKAAQSLQPPQRLFVIEMAVQAAALVACLYLKVLFFRRNLVSVDIFGVFIVVFRLAECGREQF